MLFLSALTNEPSTPASRHRSIGEAAALSLYNIAVCIFLLHDQQLRVDRIHETFAEVRNLL
jgi:hypothetical protein